MKNYLPLYIIVVLLAGIFVFGRLEIASVERELLAPATAMHTKLAAGGDITDDFLVLDSRVRRHEVTLNLIVNRSAYNDVVRCMLEIENDIKYDRRAELDADVARLIHQLNDIIGNEKAEINNIF